jgi:predicted  nucleic acid-binding Zn-ribbon protein
MNGRLKACVVVALVWGCGPEEVRKPVQTDTASAEIVRLRTQLAEKERETAAERAYIEEATQTINDVQDGLSAIAPVERTVRATASEHGEVSATQRERMLASISSVKAELEAKTQRIAEFQRKNAQFEHKVAPLERTIATLQALVKAKTKEISSLQGAMEQSERRVTQLTVERTEDKQRIEQASAQLEDTAQQLKMTRQELNLGFFLIAKADDLVQKHILTRSGGIIRKKSYALTGSAKHLTFDTLDISTATTIPIHLTGQNRYLFPPRENGTYHWSDDGSAPALVIDDAKVFWACRYLIIAVD